MWEGGGQTHLESFKLLSPRDEKLKIETDLKILKGADIFLKERNSTSLVKHSFQRPSRLQQLLGFPESSPPASGPLPFQDPQHSGEKASRTPVPMSSQVKPGVRKHAVLLLDAGRTQRGVPAWFQARQG